jgi:Holliday junction resolvase YEN1
VQFALRGVHAQAGENPELRDLFYKLLNLLKYPITPIFVFDGASRPTSKRGVVVVTRPHWLVNPLKEMLDLLRFLYYTVGIILSTLF